MIAACGAGNGPASLAPATASGQSSASVDGRMKPLVDGAALWLEADKKLVIVMTTIPLTPDQRASLAAADSDLMLIEGNQPYLKIAINVADPDKPLEPGNVTAWRVAFWNFHPNDPMTINRMKADDLNQLGGSLAQGSSITFGVNTTLDWTMDPARRYECRLSHSVPLLKGR